MTFPLMIPSLPRAVRLEKWASLYIGHSVVSRRFLSGFALSLISFFFFSKTRSRIKEDRRIARGGIQFAPVNSNFWVKIDPLIVPSDFVLETSFVLRLPAAQSDQECAVLGSIIYS